MTGPTSKLEHHTLIKTPHPTPPPARTHLTEGPPRTFKESLRDTNKRLDTFSYSDLIVRNFRSLCTSSLLWGGQDDVIDLGSVRRLRNFFHPPRTIELLMHYRADSSL